MKEGQPSVIYLKDYQVPDFLIEETVLSFDINEGETQVTSELRMVRNPAAAIRLNKSVRTSMRIT